MKKPIYKFEELPVDLRKNIIKIIRSEFEREYLSNV